MVRPARLPGLVQFGRNSTTVRHSRRRCCAALARHDAVGSANRPNNCWQDRGDVLTRKTNEDKRGDGRTVRLTERLLGWRIDFDRRRRYRPITSRSAAQFAPEFDPRRGEATAALVGSVDRMNRRTTDVDGVKVVVVVVAGRLTSNTAATLKCQ